MAPTQVIDGRCWDVAEPAKLQRAGHCAPRSITLLSAFCSCLLAQGGDATAPLHGLAAGVLEEACRKLLSRHVPLHTST